jgi:hypothetical protein
MAHPLVREMLFEGRVRVSEKRELALTDDDLIAMKSALAIQSLHLAGGGLQGSLETLILATAIVYRFCWRFYNSEPLAAADDPSLQMPSPPLSPEEHAAADVAFRLLPGLYQRLVRRDPGSPLGEALKKLLRQWPLSGVLANIAEPPEAPIEFGGHVGLGFVYAERLAANERQAWVPDGAARECVELVYHAMGRRLPEAADAGPGAES